MSNTRAQGMSINIIIIAAIALIILVILVVLVLDSTSRVGEGANSCEAIGGQCVPEWEGCPPNAVENRLRSCPDGGFGDAQICCIPQ